MWTDIDYMDLRKVFTLDPDRFPLEKVRELVAHLHENDQHYIMMVDAAVAYQDYPPFNDGVEIGAFMRNDEGSVFQGMLLHLYLSKRPETTSQVLSGLV